MSEPDRDEVDVDAVLAAFLATEEKLKGDARTHALEQLAAKRWDDLGVLEHAGRLLFPDALYRRDAKTGQFLPERCLLMVPRGSDLRKARIEAYSMAKEQKLDADRDQDLIKELESLAKLWLSVRAPTPPYEPLTMDPFELEKRFDTGSLEQAIGKVAALGKVLNPKLAGMTPDELCALTAAIVERQDIRPLFVFDDATQTSFIVTLAWLHQTFLKVRSSAGSQAPSTAD